MFQLFCADLDLVFSHMSKRAGRALVSERNN